MTAQLSREDVKELRNSFQCWQQDYDPKEDAEQYEMFGRAITATNMLLAGMDSEPSFGDHLELIDKGRLMMLERSHQTLLDYRADSVWYWQGDEDDQPEILSCPVMMSAETLRELLAKAEPTAPVAVPDEWRMMCGEWRDEAVSIHDASGLIVSGVDANVAGVIVEAHNACISAMLKTGPVKAATVPDGWVAVINRLLDNDGSRGRFSAIACHEAHEEIERLLAAAHEQEV